MIRPCILLTTLLCLINSVFANDTAVKLKGQYEFQSGFRDHNLQSIIPNISRYNGNVAFNSSANMSVELDHRVNDTTMYGVKIAIDTTTKNNRTVASTLYMLSRFGKFEAGSDKSVTNKMKITGYSVGAGTFGSWDGWTVMTRSPENIVYIVNFGNFLDGKIRDGSKVEYPRKISYFTPSVAGVQLGVSYIPDSSNTGYNSFDNPTYHKLNKSLPTEFLLKDGIGYGATWAKTFSTDLKFNIAFVGEKAIVRNKLNTQIPSDKLTNLNNYTIGSMIDYKQYSIAASYGNYMRSLTSANYDKIGRDTYLYSFGGRYKYSQFTSSIHYLFSNHKQNKFHAITAATDYKIGTGILTYIEATQYHTSGKFLNNDVVTTDRTKGKLLIIGCKVYF
jgi:hypothetical protein